MNKRMEDKVAGLIAKAKPAEINRIARWSIEMMVASDRRARSKNEGDRFGAASFDRDAQIARDNIWKLVETLQGRPDRVIPSTEEPKS